MCKNGVIHRLEKIYRLAESQDDIKSMIKIIELTYKINSQNIKKFDQKDLSTEQLEALIEHLTAT